MEDRLYLDDHSTGTPQKVGNYGATINRTPSSSSGLVEGGGYTYQIYDEEEMDNDRKQLLHEGSFSGRNTFRISRDLLKRRRTFADWCKIIFTFQHIKQAIVLSVFFLTIYLFSSEREDFQNLHLAASSARHPVPIEVTLDHPIEILQVQLFTQQAKEGTELNVVLQKRDKSSQDKANRVWQGMQSWNFTLTNISVVEHEKLKHRFSILEDDSSKPFPDYRLLVLTNSTMPLAFNIDIYNLPEIVKYQVLFAALILAAVYILIVFELVHKTIAAMLGAFVGLALLSKIYVRPTLEEVVSWIDFETCGLLFGMMVMVGIFSQTGFFEWTAVRAYKWSKGDVWKLVTILCSFTAFVSAFLDNVTTILLLTPVTLRLCKVLEIPPGPIIISLVVFSNLGGTGTPVGDPPNILIVNDASIRASGQVTFMTFSLHMIPGVLLAAVGVYFVLRKIVKPQLKREPNMNQKREIDVWRKTANKMRTDTEEEKEVRKKLDSYIDSLEDELKKSVEPKMIDIAELEEKYRITDKQLFVNSCLVISTVVVLFFINNIVNINLSLAWIAIIGAMAHLVISGIRDFDEVMEKVEFGTLMFFSGLFILMKTLEELGLIEYIGEQISHVIAGVPAGNLRLVVAVLLILWVSALVSAIIDNIPFTAAMIPVIIKLADGELGLPLSPLVWSLAFGTCFGGNGTLIGASANVVAAGISESQGYPIRFNEFVKIGFPVTAVSVFIVNIYLLVFHVLISWR